MKNGKNPSQKYKKKEVDAVEDIWGSDITKLSKKRRRGTYPSKKIGVKAVKIPHPG